MKRLQTLIALLVVVGVVILGSSRSVVRAADTNCDNADFDKNEYSESELSKIISDCEKKRSEASQQAQSLSQAIGGLDRQIALNQAQIQRTRLEIEALEREIVNLSERISGLEVSLGDLSKALIDRIQEQYKQSKVDKVTLFFAGDGISSLIKKQQYIRKARAHTEDIMMATEYKRQVYDDEKTTKEEKQAEVERLKQKLDSQQADLAQQRTEKQQLLTVTKNNEQNYQNLISQARAELASFRSFTSGQSGGVLPPQNSPDGWYFSQRDERWAGACIGASCGTGDEARILEVGCLIASTAMVKKKYGEDVTPLTIARNTSYFVYPTAYMLRPWPAPKGKHYETSAFSQSKLDSELKEDRPVIVHLRVNTRDGHFVVIKSGKNGDYVMHDPWEGYDKKFSDYYSLGQITQMSVLR